MTGHAPTTKTAAAHARLQQLLDQLVADAQVGLDRREHPRQPVQMPVTLGLFIGRDGEAACVAHGDPASREYFRAAYQGWATDLSAQGIGLLIDRPLPAHTFMTVRFDAVTQPVLQLPMQVIYCKQLLACTYRIGGLFLTDGDDSHQARAD